MSEIYISKNGETFLAEGDELDYVISWQKEAKQSQLDLELQIKTTAESRASALAKLAALGLTEEEIAAL